MSSHHPSRCEVCMRNSIFMSAQSGTRITSGMELFVVLPWRAAGAFSEPSICELSSLLLGSPSNMPTSSSLCCTFKLAAAASAAGDNFLRRLNLELSFALGLRACISSQTAVTFLSSSRRAIKKASTVCEERRALNCLDLKSHSFCAGNCCWVVHMSPSFSNDA